MSSELFATIGAPLVAGIFMLAVGWFTRRTGQESNKTADWSGFVEKQQAVNERNEEKIEGLEKRVGTLESELREERDLRERIVAYARALLWAWRRQFPEDPPPVAPESIRTYFD